MPDGVGTQPRQTGEARMPGGTVTFLFTDIEGSTALLRRLGRLYAELIDVHWELVSGAIRRHGGRVVDTQGDAVFAAFHRAADGVSAASEAQRLLSAHDWPGGADLRVRMGLHTGEPLVEGERYMGLAVHRAQRICSLARGGQVLLSSVTADLIADDLAAGTSLVSTGTHRLKDFEREEQLYELAIADVPRHIHRTRRPEPGPFSGSENALAARAAAGATVDVRLLGPVEVVRDGRSVPIGPAKQRLILALLALRQGELLSADVLIDLIWGERPPPTAGKALQVYVSELRHRVEVDRSSPSVILSQPGGYRFGPDPSCTDLGRFEGLWQRGRSTLEHGDAEEAARLLGAAAALWRGPALADLAYEPAVLSDAARLEELRLACLEDRIDADMACGRHAALVPELEGLCINHPLRERLRGQLMLALYRSGRQADALSVYQRARSDLVEQLGIDPSPALTALERRILQHDPSLQRETSAPSPSEPVHDRTVMAVSQSSDDLGALLWLAEPLARTGAQIVLARVVRPAAGVDTSERLRAVTTRLAEERESLAANGITARVAAFTSTNRGPDLVKLASQQNAQLIVLDGAGELREGHSGVFDEIVADTPCDVAMLVGGSPAHTGDAIVVPFGGSEHDWAALELAAALSRAAGKRLILAGAERTAGGSADASRLLAGASLVLQRAGGIVAEPVLIERGAQGLLELAADAHLIVAGISPNYRQEGLGETRYHIAMHAPVPAAFVRRGTRPGVLAPHATMTRFSWSLSTWGV